MKFNQLPKTINGRGLYLENAVIESVSISIADHGVMTAWLYLEFGGGGCGFGGFCLAKLNAPVEKPDYDYASNFLIRCMQIAGVEKWEDIPGRPCRCLNEGLGGTVVAVGHFLKDDWFSPKVEWNRDGK